MSTTQEMEALMKTIKDATDGLKNAEASNKDMIKSEVERTIKEALKNHPGFTPERKLTFNQGVSKELQREEIIAKMPVELQVESDKIHILSRILQVNPKSLKSWDSFSKKMGEFKKALDSTTTGEGDEWVPTELSPEVARLVRLQLKVSSLFRVIPMPSNPYEIPVQIGRFSSFKHAESTASTGQTAVGNGLTANVTQKTTLTAVGHGSLVLASDEVTEDSIVPMVPFIQQELIQALAEGREDAILNGDTAGSHEDSDITDAADRRKMWLGLRAHSNDQTYTRDLSTLQMGNLRSLRGDMGKYGVNPNDLAYVVSVSGYMKLVDLDQVTTVDKYGPSATILTGELGKIDGVPVIVSEWIRTVLNSSAVYSASGDKTVIHLVNRNGFVIGERARPEVKLLRELYAIYRQVGILASERVIFKDLYPIASNRVVNTGTNVA